MALSRAESAIAAAAPRIDGYRALSELASGDSATLAYRAVRGADEAPVLLKILRNGYATPLERASFQWEYELLRDLNIPGVVRAYDLTSYEASPVIVLEELGGQTLADLLDTRPLALVEALEYAAQLAGTLDRLHRAGILHLGVSPSCVILAKGGRAVLTDFSQATDQSGLRPAPRAVGLMAGRLAYMSPEQTGRMNRSVDDRSDLYSLGVTLYQMLTGETPFSGDDPLALIYAHIATPPIPPSDISPAIPDVLSSIVLKLMAKNAEDRYQSALGLKADLEECLRQWRATGAVQPFELGRRDVPRELRIPERLYGRERESAVLMAAFDRASQGAAELLLVSGPPGIGKTTLVNEVHRPLAQRRGSFISGKIDPLQRTVPYAALAQALRSKVEQVLTGSAVEVAIWRERVLQALGPNAGVISEIVPELKRIIGEQAPAPSNTPKEAQNQLYLAFRQFFQVLARPDDPLVLFLDDLQWADTALLGLMQSVLSAGDVSLLVIGAYRDNEVSSVHPLVQTIDEIQKSGTRVNEVRLGQLDTANVAQLISDTLACSIEAALSLAKLVMDKTDGNPFFLREFFRSLQQEGYLAFDLNTGRWTWAVDRLESLHITSNVVDLVARRVRQLSETTLRTLEAAAAIGGRFELGLLAAVVDMTPHATALALKEAIREGVVVPLDDGHRLAERVESGSDEDFQLEYRFAHDRIQQAVYSILTDGERESLHLRLARLLPAHPPQSGVDPTFDIANHLHLARGLLEGTGGQDERARINLSAGRKARAASAFATASEYYRRGIEAGGAEAWASDYGLARDLRLEGAEAAYLCGDFDRTTEWTESVVEHSATELDRVGAYEVRVMAATARAEPALAVTEGLKLLKLLGIRIPATPTKRDIVQGLLATKMLLAFRRVESLAQLPVMTDERDLTKMRLLQLVMNAAYIARPDVFPLTVFQSVMLSVRRGNSPLATQGYLGYGIMLCGVTGEIATGYKFGELALTLLDRFDARSLRPRALFLFNGFIAHWRKHYRETFAPLREAYQLGLESGDFNFAGLAAFDYTFQAYWSGENLMGLERELANYAEVFRTLNQEIYVQLLNMYRQAALNLISGAPRPDMLIGECYDEQAVAPTLEATHNINALCQLHLHKMILAFLFRRHEDAAGHAVKVREYLEGLTATQGVPVFHFYAALNELAMAGKGFAGRANDPSARARKIVRGAVRKLRKWAASAPMNYAHRLHLVEAELARVLGRDAAAREHYDKAILLAGQNQFLNDVALAAELAGRYHLERGLTHVARAYLRDAHYGYTQWGAHALARQIETSFPQFIAQSALAPADLSGSPTQASGTGLDLVSVLRASQVISSEIELEPLLRRLMSVVMESSGARRACFLFERERQLFIEAEVTADSPEVTLQAQPADAMVDGRPLLPLSIVNFVIHTQESVLLDDAIADPRFRRDPYLIRVRPHSVLCAPLVKHGRITGVLYLENDLNRGAFTPARLGLLNHMAAQAAISVDNARLYGDIRALNTAYQRFVPRQFLGILDRKAITDVILGDRAQREMTVLFSDIRQFTRLSEGMGLDGTFAFMNRYLGRMVPAIEAHHGIVDKYVGDAIMALFPRQADDGLEAAIAMMRALAKLNEDLAAEGRPPLQVGIGLHYGQLLMGMVGVHGRMDGTVIGDAVNVASRIEGSTRAYGLSLLLTAQVRDRLEFPGRFALREIDRVRVVGREEPVTLFESFDADAPEMGSAKRESLPLIAGLIDHYRSGRLDEAAACAEATLARAPDDLVAQLYLARCKSLARAGLPENWDGVGALGQK